MEAETYVVATLKEWNLQEYHARVQALPGQWHLIQEPNELTLERLRHFKPRYVFFPHWSTKVPADIVQEFECVCFHMTDLPYGRGGSPLQNLIVRKHKSTVVTALRMTEKLDDGPVYLKVPLSLDGSAGQIFERASRIVFDAIGYMISNRPIPVLQVGEAEYFARRKPSESVLLSGGSLEDLYDHIRMLDAESYPNAFVQHGDWRVEFSGARLLDGAVEARARIVKADR